MQAIDIVPITTVDQLEEMMQIEEQIWRESSIPIHQTFTAIQNGGICLGAYDEGRLVGFLYSFAGFDGRTSYLCSHNLGFLEPYRKMGLGEKMKREQAVRAKAAGYPFITWTFDPLESVNAYVNIHKLGATGHAYSPNHYGELNDGLNGGLPTDRMIIRWDMNEPKSDVDEKNRQQVSLLTIDDDKNPVVLEDINLLIFDEESLYTIHIPDDFQTIKESNIEQALEWRLQTSAIFQELFANQFKAIDLKRDAQSNQITYIFAHTIGGEK